MLKLKELREELNLSQLDIAKGIETSQRNISRWENGTNEPTSSFVVKLSDYFQCTTDYLLGRENEYGIIETKNNSLSENENQLVNLFRKLNERDQNKVLGYIQALAF